MKSLPGILIVDDQLHTLRLLEYNLRPLGARVHVAKNSADALAVARREGSALRLAMLDYELPDGNGFDLIAQVKQLPNLNLLPVVMITAAGQMAIRTQAEQIGITGFFTKPFSPRELVSLVSGLLVTDTPSPKTGKMQIMQENSN
jgi:DNA-binding response OmpR family regulator